MTTMPMLTARSWRARRLARGWTEVQLIGRMKLAARAEGVSLPRTYQLARWMFLWENHRAPVPAYYADLFSVAFNTDAAHRAARRGAARD